METSSLVFLALSSGALVTGAIVILATLVAVFSREPRRRADARRILRLLVDRTDKSRPGYPPDDRDDE